MVEHIGASGEALSEEEDIKRRAAASALRRAARDSAGLHDRLLAEGYGRGLSDEDKEKEIAFVMALTKRRKEWLEGKDEKQKMALAIRWGQLQTNIQKRFEAFCTEKGVAENMFSRYRGVRALIGSSLEPHKKDHPDKVEGTVDFYDSFNPPAPFTIAALADEIEGNLNAYKAGTKELEPA
jgi:hypothetical protein